MEEIIEVELVEVVEVIAPPAYVIDEKLIKSFLCETTTMSFQTNPSDSETIYPMSCNLFSIDS